MLGMWEAPVLASHSTYHGRMGTLVRNNLLYGRPKKKWVRVRPNTLKKWVEYGAISGRGCLLDEPASQWEACIYIHVHNLFVWCNHNIPQLLIFTNSATPHLWASFPFFHGPSAVQCASHYIYEHCTFSTLSILSWHTSLQTIGWENKKQWESSNTTLHNIDIDSLASLWLG